MNNLTIKHTKRFKKSYNKLISTQNFNKENFKFVIDALLSEQILPQQFRNHLLIPKSKRHMGMSYFSRLSTFIWKKFYI